MKVLIIEDEERGFSRLKRLLQNIDNSLEIQGPLTTMKAVINYLQNPHDEDIIFADIRLGDGDVFEAFLEIAPTSPVIFTTAYSEYALEAFKSNGIAYLQKPILHEELEKALAKAKAMCNQSIDYSALMEKMGMPVGKKWRKHFLVHIFDGFKLIKTTDISYFFSENGVVRAFLCSGNSVTINQSLNDLEQQLNPDLFFRVNRQYMVNIDSIDKLANFFKYKMTISLHGFPDLRIVVSKDRVTQLKNWLDR